METFTLYVLVATALLNQAFGIDIGSDMRSFSSAIKGGLLNAGEEKVLYERNIGQPGIITEQWFTGSLYIA